MRSLAMLVVALNVGLSGFVEGFVGSFVGSFAGSFVGSFVVLMPSNANADDGFRCKSGRLVSVGDGMREVRNRCGDPDFATTRTERRKIKYRYSRWVGNIEESIVEEREVEVPVEEWTYDLGPNAFVRYVTFENGRVVGVTAGDYGR